MKIRGGFVTNSSSSSFILSFKDEDSIYNTLKNQFPENIEEGWSAGDGYIYQLLKEIEEADRMTKDDVLEVISAEDTVEWDILGELEYGKKKWSHERAIEYIVSQEGQLRIEEIRQANRKEIMDKIGDNKVIVTVNHGSGGEGEDGVLENILPDLDCTAATFSHH
jgi:hypothetical protein